MRSKMGECEMFVCGPNIHDHDHHYSASLVPAYSFGETDGFVQGMNRWGSPIRRVQVRHDND